MDNILPVEKHCCTCGITKLASEFYIHKVGRRAGTLASVCKVCKKVKNKHYKTINLARETARRRQWRLDNPEKSKAYRKAYNKVYRANPENKAIRNKQDAEKRKTDPLFRAKKDIRNMIYDSITKMGFVKRQRTADILGCTIIFFKEYLEKQFKDGMDWLNHGTWHIDHIIPLASAKTEEEVIKLNHYTNFQPLWAKDNLKKGDKMPEEWGQKQQSYNNYE